MPFPTTPVLDDFNRANEGPPPSSNWTIIYPGTDTGARVVSNQCVAAGTGTIWADGWNVSTFGPGSEVYCTVATVPTANALRLFIRLSALNSNTPNGYNFKWTPSTSALVIRRTDAGVHTTLATGSVALANGNAAGLEAIGSALAVYKSTGGAYASVLNTTDSTYSAAGYIAFEFDDAATALDNFGGGSFFETGPAVAGVFVGGADIISGPTYGAFQVNAFQNDAFQIYDTGGASYNETGAGVAGTFAAGADRRSLAESGAGVAGVVASGADALSNSESGAAVGGNVAAGAERFTWTETASAIAGVFAAGAETVTLSDGGYGLAGVLASGAEQFTGGAVTYNETGAGVAGAEAYVTDAAALVESGYSIAGAAVFGADAWTMTDTGAALVGGAAYGSDAATSSESGAGLLGAIAAGADAYTMGDSGYGLAGAVAAGADLTVTAGPAARAELVRQFGAAVAEDDTAARAPAARVQQSGATARGKGSKVA